MDDKPNFVFKRMLFAKSTQAYAAFGRGICHLMTVIQHIKLKLRHSLTFSDSDMDSENCGVMIRLSVSDVGK